MTDPYEIELHASKQPKRRVWLEPLILIAIILGYCLLMGWLQKHDFEQKVADYEAEVQKQCQNKPYSDALDFKCELLDEHYARLN